MQKTRLSSLTILQSLWSKWEWLIPWLDTKGKLGRTAEGLMEPSRNHFVTSFVYFTFYFDSFGFLLFAFVRVLCFGFESWFFFKGCILVCHMVWGVVCFYFYVSFNKAQSLVKWNQVSSSIFFNLSLLSCEMKSSCEMNFFSLLSTKKLEQRSLLLRDHHYHLTNFFTWTNIVSSV